MEGFLRAGHISSIFNWNPGNSVGQKRKERVRSKVTEEKNWTHNFVCLSNINASSPPDLHCKLQGWVKKEYLLVYMLMLTMYTMSL